MNNILIGEIKVGQTIEFRCKLIKVAKIQRGCPTGLVIGYNEYGDRVKIPFNNYEYK